MGTEKESGILKGAREASTGGRRDGCFLREHQFTEGVKKKREKKKKKTQRKKKQGKAYF